MKRSRGCKRGSGGVRLGAVRGCLVAGALSAVIVVGFGAVGARPRPLPTSPTRAATSLSTSLGAGGLLTPLSPPTVAAGFAAVEVAVSPDGGSVYVTNSGADSVSQYDVGRRRRASPKSPPAVPAGSAPFGVAVSPDGGSVYVANAIGDTSPSTTQVRAARFSPRARPRWPRSPARTGWR